MSQCRGRWLLALVPFVLLPSLHAQTPRTNAGRAAPAVRSEEPTVKVRHLEEQNGWDVAESSSFRLYHQHSREMAVAVLQTAERARTAQQRKWFDGVESAWTPKCRIYLYPNGEAYSEATGAPANPGGGHTNIQLGEERVVDRCIHLHGPRRLLLGGVLPHEVTHAVLAGHFGGERVPRWADEGMAILAEAQSRIDLHLHQLPRWREGDRLFGSGELIEMHDYPRPHSIPVFYAQSVSLVDFLFRAKGAKCFTAFVRDGERLGYKTALRRHYGWTFAELDRRWQDHVFGTTETTTASFNGGG